MSKIMTTTKLPEGWRAFLALNEINPALYDSFILFSDESGYIANNQGEPTISFTSISELLDIASPLPPRKEVFTGDGSPEWWKRANLPVGTYKTNDPVFKEVYWSGDTFFSKGMTIWEPPAVDAIELIRSPVEKPGKTWAFVTESENLPDPGFYYGVDDDAVYLVVPDFSGNKIVYQKRRANNFSPCNFSLLKILVTDDYSTGVYESNSEIFGQEYAPYSFKTDNLY